jgi:hypothetical protein
VTLQILYLDTICSTATIPSERRRIWRSRSEARDEEVEMLERVLEIRFTRYGTILEELEIICRMTGFRRRVLVEYMADGTYCSVDLGSG